MGHPVFELFDSFGEFVTYLMFCPELSRDKILGGAIELQFCGEGTRSAGRCTNEYMSVCCKLVIHKFIFDSSAELKCTLMYLLYL